MFGLLITQERRADRPGSRPMVWLALGVRALRTLLGLGASRIHVRVKRI